MPAFRGPDCGANSWRGGGWPRPDGRQAWMAASGGVKQGVGPICPTNLIDFASPGEYDDGCSWVGRSPSRPAHRGSELERPPTAPLREGDSEMDLLSRHSKLALLLLVLFALTAGPGIWTSHPTVSWIAAAPAWAGSPDETLKPPPNPPPGSRAAAFSGLGTAPRGVTAVSVTSTRPSRGLERLEHLVIVWKLYLRHALRF